MPPHCLSRQDVSAAYDYGQFYIYTGYIDEDPRDNTVDLLDEAYDGGENIAQGPHVLLVAVPPHHNFEMVIAFERWDSTPPDDGEEWQEICEACLDITGEGLTFDSPTLEGFDLPEVPPGRYAIRISGRGFVEDDFDEGPPADQWRFQLWPVRESFPARRIASWSGPEGAGGIPALVASIEALGRTAEGDLEALAKVREYLAPELRQDVREAAVKALAVGWSGDANIEMELRTLAGKDKDIYIRVTALIALAQGWPGPDTLAILMAAATKKARGDREGILRWNSVREAAIIGAGEPTTLAWLKDLATGDDGCVWREAFAGIGTGWHDAETLAWLQGQIVGPPGRAPSAFWAIRQGWAGDPAPVPWLLQMAGHTVHEVRANALWALGGWRAHPDVLPFLRRIASDRRDDCRLEAMRALFDNWGDDESVSAWVAELMERDFPEAYELWRWVREHDED